MCENCEVAFLSHCLGDLHMRFIYTWLESEWLISYKITEQLYNYEPKYLQFGALLKGVGYFGAKY